MILNLIRGGNISTIIIGILVSAFVVFCICPIHEFAHAFVAYKMGDNTAKNQGRLTLSPFAHINWLGALMILLVGFGYAEPVPINVRNVKIKNKKIATALIALAGPVSNLIVAFLSLVAMFLIVKFAPANSMFAFNFRLFFEYSTLININLAVFNLIPVPPLDGSRILFCIFPTKYYFAVMKYERYIVWGIMILLFTGVLSAPISALSNLILNGMLNLLNMVF